MTDNSHKKYTKQKIDTYVSAVDITRLTAICERYGYKSIYQLLQYLVHCFLRVADAANDTSTDELPDELKEMFISPNEYRKLKKREAGRLEVQLLIPFGEYRSRQTKKLLITSKGMKLSDEITEMFSDNSEWEQGNHSYGSHKDMLKKRKPDQRKVKTANDL